MSSRIRDGTFATWLIIAIGLSLIALVAFTVASSKGYQRAYQQNEAENASYAQREGHYRSCLMLPSVEQARECAENAPEADRAERRAEEDLNAQREMADWAEGVLWATLASVGVTAVGIVFVWRSLNANTAAVDQARRANDIADQHSRADLRAWLIVKINSIGPIFRESDNIFVSVDASIENTGRSPATDLCFYIDIVSLFNNDPKLGPRWFDGATTSRRTGGGNDALGPNEVRSIRVDCVVHEKDFASAGEFLSLKYKMFIGVVYRTIIPNHECFTFKVLAIQGSTSIENGDPFHVEARWWDMASKMR
ncbi:hypothetical protein GTW51_13845 [Aurantimonas aggregata]|uniref:Uncharacterized protein n=1 Tax=Aurantimonas aggregata TaxID=2047720 RepID=A0A6L9MIR9_9HYPH|nr:hypothetical protein [Aurantimonas aggregata]NDV87784.1 hypothetical protein [Aurantimonas aggregata]